MKGVVLANMSGPPNLHKATVGTGRHHLCAAEGVKAEPLETAPTWIQPGVVEKKG